MLVVCRRSKGMWWVRRSSSSRGMGLCIRWMGVCVEKWIGVDKSVAYDCVKGDGTSAILRRGVSLRAEWGRWEMEIPLIPHCLFLIY